MTDDDEPDLLSLLRHRRRPAAEAPKPAPAPPAPVVQAPPTVPSTASGPGGEEDDLGVAISARRPRLDRRGLTLAPPPAEVASVRVGTERLLDPAAPEEHLRKVARVTEAQRWSALMEHLGAAGPDLRWRAVGWVLQQELAYAERVVSECRRPRRGAARPRKADAVEAAAAGLEAQVAHIEAVLSSLGPALADLSGLAQALDRAGASLGLARGHLAAVCGEGVWMAGWAGADVGTGIPGYDTAEGVERHRAEVRSEVEKFRARRDAAKATKAERGRAEWVEPVKLPAAFAAVADPGLFDATIDPDEDGDT